MSFWDKYQAYVYVGLLTVVTWWMQQLYEQHDMMRTVTENSPDFFSTGYFKREMGPDGLPKNELLAEGMQHFKHDGSTQLNQPVMTLFNPNAAPWIIQADSAIMAADGDHLQLNGKVSIHRDAAKGASALQIDTTDLQVKLSTHYAETSAWANIVSPPHQTSGTGMEVTFVSPIHLKLLSKVKGRYEIK